MRLLGGIFTAEKSLFGSWAFRHFGNNFHQIRDKKAHRKHIATMTPINAKSVQLIELHAFAYCLLSVSLSESFDFLKINKIYLSATCVHVLQI